MARAVLLSVCLASACTREAAKPAETQAQPQAPEQAAAASPAAPKAPPLSPEDIALIEADPSTLTPELRRKRAFALRRKIMQNPGSPVAQSLERTRKAIESGELEPTLPGRGLKLHTPTKKTKPATEP